MAHRYSFQQIQDYLDKQEVLKLSNVNPPNVESVLDFLTWYFKEKNPATETISNKYYCSNTRYRSIGDLYRLCKNYYDTTFEEVFNCICTLIKSHLISSLSCKDACKRVYMNTINWGYMAKGGFFNNHPTDEFGNDFLEIANHKPLYGYSTTINHKYIDL